MRPADGTPAEAMPRLLAAAEHSCVVMQTLLGGVRIDRVVNGEKTDGARGGAR